MLISHNGSEWRASLQAGLSVPRRAGLKACLLGLVFFALIFVVGCGTEAEPYDVTVPTQTDPYISRIVPSAVAAGDIVSIFGFGFSDAAEFNVVVIDGISVFADSYSLVLPPVAGEVEGITFVVPAGISVGTHSISVDVLGNVSNSNVSITIN